VRDAARRDEQPALADAVLLALDVHKQLTLEHVDCLVLVRVAVQRRHLSVRHAVLEHDERAPGLRGGRLPREYPAAGEPHLLALVGLSDDGCRVAHRSSLRCRRALSAWR